MTDAASSNPAPESDVRLESPYFVVNPNSADGATGRRWPKLEAAARAALGPLDVGLTRGPLDAVPLTREALRRGHRCIVAVGGDGTLNEVVNGFFDEAGNPLASDATFSVLPQGTGGDFRRTLGLNGRFADALAAFRQAPVRRIDLGRVTFRAHDGSMAVRHYINVASVGVSGAIGQQVNSSSKRLGGYLTFMLASARALASWKDVTVRFSVDGGPWQTAPITCLAMANGRFFGGGMKVAPGAELDDGLFHVTRWFDYGVGTFVFRQPAIYAGRHVEWERTKTFTARRVEIQSDDRVLLEIDGEQPGGVPATFEVVPGALLLRG